MSFFKKSFALEQFIFCLSFRELIFHNATNEIRLRYIKTFFGPFWTILSIGIFVLSFGFIGSRLWGLDVNTFLPTFAAGYIVWICISSIISESTTILSQNESTLKSVNIPIMVFLLSMGIKNIIIFFHHLVFFLIICFFFSQKINLNIILIIPSLAILSIIGILFSFSWSILCTRFNDLAQFTNNLLQIFFFITPVFWPAERLTGTYFKLLIDLNPIYQVLNIIKQPLLGNTIDLNNLYFCIFLIIILFFLSILLGNKYRKKLIFFL